MNENKNNNQKSLPSRQIKNQDLYNEINNEEIKEFNLNSNVSVIDDDGNNIDLGKIQNLLEKRYQNNNELNKKIEYQDQNERDLKLDETREYDINSVLEKARETKEVNYEVDRLKKARNTQFEILNSLNLNEPEETLKEELTSLIETIESNEVDPFDMLSDLKGTEDTVVVPGFKEEFEDTEEYNDFNNTEEYTVVTEEIEIDDDEEEEPYTEEIEVVEEYSVEELEENSINMKFSERFKEEPEYLDSEEDLEPLFEENDSKGKIIMFLSTLLIITLIIGIVYILNGLLDWKLFIK